MKKNALAKIITKSLLLISFYISLHLLCHFSCQIWTAKGKTFPGLSHLAKQQEKELQSWKFILLHFCPTLYPKSVSFPFYLHNNPAKWIELRSTFPGSLIFMSSWRFELDKVDSGHYPVLAVK